MFHNTFPNVAAFKQQSLRRSIRGLSGLSLRAGLGAAACPDARRLSGPPSVSSLQQEVLKVRFSRLPRAVKYQDNQYEKKAMSQQLNDFEVSFLTNKTHNFGFFLMCICFASLLSGLFSSCGAEAPGRPWAKLVFAEPSLVKLQLGLLGSVGAGSVVAALGLACPQHVGAPAPGSNACLPPWRADSPPPSHQGEPANQNVYSKTVCAVFTNISKTSELETDS